MVDWIDENCDVVMAADADSGEEVEQYTSLTEALNGPEGEEWAKALKSEKDNFGIREIFGDAPQTGKAMRTKIILRKTRKPDGSWKYKVRLVAKGFTQVKGVNYNETYAGRPYYQHCGCTDVLESVCHVWVSPSCVRCDCCVSGRQERLPQLCVVAT